MHCEDLDLKKGAETPQFAQDLSEIKFSINSIVLAKTQLPCKFEEIPFDSSKNSEFLKITLLLEFYSLLSGCKLKQKITKVSIQKNSTVSSETYSLTLSEDAVNLKVSFPTNQEYEIIGKVFLLQDEKSKDQNKVKEMIGTFKINLLEWKKETQKQNGSGQQHNPESILSLKMVELRVNIQNQKSKKGETNDSDQTLTSETKRGQISGLIREIKTYSFDQQLNLLENFIEFRLINQKQIGNTHPNFNMESIQELAYKKRMLETDSPKTNDKSPKIQRSQFLTTRSPQMYLVPDKQLLKKLDRPKSQALLQPLRLSKLRDSNIKPVPQNFIKRQPKSFKQQIYQLLKEVRTLKNHSQLYKKSYERNTEISRIKNLYLMGSGRKEQSQSNVFYEKSSHKRTITEFEEMAPISSIIKKSQSEINLSIFEKELQPSASLSSLNSKQRHVSRVQERLQSFEKMNNLFRMNLFNIKESQEVSEKQIRALN